MKSICRVICALMLLAGGSFAQCTEQGGFTEDVGNGCFAATAYMGCLNNNMIELCVMSVIVCETSNGFTMEVTDYGCTGSYIG